MATPSEVTFGQLLYSSIAFMLLAAGAILLFFTTYQRRLLQQQVQLQLAETQHQQQLLAVQQQLLGAVIEAQERERERIGQDLHDGLGSALATAKLLVGRLGGGQPAADNPTHLFALLEELMSTMVHEVRSISHSLYPAVLARFGLAEAIQHLVDTCNEIGKLPVSLHMAYFQSLDLEQELALYRICQELLANAFKHATGASQLRVQLLQHPTQLTLIVEDDGCGFPPTAPGRLPGSGAGLRSIGARVQLLQGHLQQGVPEAGPGTRTIIDIPFQQL